MKKIKIDKKKVISLYVDEKLKQREIAKIMKCSQYCVWNVLKENNIKGNGKRTLRDVEDKEIIDLFVKKKMSFKQIAEKYGCCGDYIRKILKRNGINTNTHKCEIDIEYLRELVNKGKTQKEIAAIFNCSYKVISRRCKKHNIDVLVGSEKWILLGTKKCGFCKEIKNICEFDINEKQIVETYCKKCTIEYNRQCNDLYVERNKAKNEKFGPEKILSKACSRCKKIKLIEEFNKSFSALNGFQYLCKECQAEDYTNYINKFPEKDHERRNKRRDLESLYNSDCYKITMSVFKGRCFNCEGVKYLAVDHNYPLSMGFPLTVENAVVLCRSCNSKKHTQLPEDFYSKVKIKKLKKILKLAVKMGKKMGLI